MPLATRLLHRASTATTPRATRAHKKKNTDRASPRAPRRHRTSSTVARASRSLGRDDADGCTYPFVRFFLVCVRVLYWVFVYENTSVGRCKGRAFGGVSSLVHGVKRGFSMEGASTSGGDGWIGIGSDSTTRERDSRREEGTTTTRTRIARRVSSSSSSRRRARAASVVGRDERLSLIHI